MGRGRISMKALRKIIELQMKTGFSNRQISEATDVSRPVVTKYIEAFALSGLTWEEYSTLTDTKAIEQLPLPKETKNPRYAAALSTNCLTALSLNSRVKYGVPSDISFGYLV